MANDTVKIRFKIEGNEELKGIEVDLKSLGKAIDSVRDHSEILGNNLVRLASKAQIAESLCSVVQQLSGAFQELSSAYAEQNVAETKLAQAMQNTMGATADEIEAIKQLCSEQQKLGVIGDEVQIAASQELATYLSMSSNLKTLIPVMNDMVAQQYGLGASAESATQIASMLGKVMNGQTEALSRYGYKFDEAQKRILQYGTESERAAVLAQVVSEAVGGMNERLAQTPAGKMQQLKNTIGDVKEQLGGVIQNIMPVMTLLSNATNVAGGWVRLKSAMEALTKSTQIAKTQTQGLIVAKQGEAAANTLCAKTAGVATVATKGLTASVVALYTALTLGIAAAITGITYALGFWGRKNKEVAKTQSELTSRVNDEIRELDELRNKIESTTISQGERQQAIQTFNDKYGEYAGKLLDEKSKVNDVAEAYRKAKVAIVEKVAAEMKSEYVSKAKEKEVKATQKLIKTIGKLTDSKGNALSDSYQGKLYQYITERSDGKQKWDSQTIFESIQEAFPALGANGINVEKDWDKLWGAIKNLQEKQQNTNDQEKEYDSFMKGFTDQLKNTIANTNGEKEASFKEWFADKKKDYQEAVRDYNKAVANGTREEVDTAKKRMDDLAKQLKDYGFNPSTGKKLSSAEKQAHIKDSYKESLTTDLKSSEKKRQADVESAKLGAMKEGLAKERATLEEQHRLEGQEIDAWYASMMKKNEEYQKNLYKEKNNGSLKGFKLNTESSERIDIEEEYYNRREQLANNYAAKQAVLDKKILGQSEKDRAEYLIQYGEWQERKAAINEKYNKLIAQAENEWQKKALAQERDSLLGKRSVANHSKIVDMQTEREELEGLEGKSLKMKLELIGLDGVMQKIREIREMLSNPANDLTEEQRKSLIGLEKQYNKYLKTLIKSDKSLISGWGIIRGISGSIESMTDALKGQGSAWKKISAVVDGAISIYQSIGPIIELIKMLTGVTKAQTVAKQIEGQANLQAGAEAITGAGMEVAASKAVQTEKAAETTANVGAAASALMSAHSGIPFVGFAIGAAMVVAMLALMASLPKFADGGIAYGPTLGLFGEYAGASRNPEVVAPLDRLKGLLQDSTGFGSGRVTFRIEGRTLVGVLDKESHYRQRT